MSFLTEKSFLAGLFVTVIGIVFFYCMFNPSKCDLRDIKIWITRDDWSGKKTIAKLESWEPTETKYGNDFFYDFTFSLVIDGIKGRYTAKGLVRPNEINKLKKGVYALVKYSSDTPRKFAIIRIIFNE